MNSFKYTLFTVIMHRWRKLGHADRRSYKIVPFVANITQDMLISVENDIRGEIPSTWPKPELILICVIYNDYASCYGISACRSKKL